MLFVYRSDRVAPSPFVDGVVTLGRADDRPLSDFVWSQIGRRSRAGVRSGARITAR